MAHTYLVTGASRGLGAEFVRQLRGAGHDVIAAVRRPGTADGAAAAGARVVALDVAKPDTFDAFVAEVGQPIDVLVNNAGVAARDGRLSALSLDTFEDVFRTNVFGLALLTRALLPLLGRGARKTIVNVSSSLGSMALTQGGFSYAYCASKAALNLLTVHLHKELASDGFTVVSIDPGWNRTDMGGGEAPLDPQDTVRGMVGLMVRFGPADSGTFVGWDGATRPW